MNAPHSSAWPRCAAGLALGSLAVAAPVAALPILPAITVTADVPRPAMPDAPGAHRGHPAAVPALLDRFVGSYRFSPTDVLTVTREGNRLFGQEPGLERFELLPDHARRFALAAIDAEVEFVLGGEGPAATAIWRQGSHAEHGARIPGAPSPPAAPELPPSFVPVHPRTHRLFEI